MDLNVIFHFQSNFQQLFILFILQSYCLFHNIIIFKLSTDQSAIKVMAVAEKKNVSSFENHEPIQSPII